MVCVQIGDPSPHSATQRVNRSIAEKNLPSKLADSRQYISESNTHLVMESIWNLLYLLEPASIALIVTAVAVMFASAFRALNHEKEMERNRGLSEASITLDRSQALMIPIMSSCSLLLMFYFFPSVSQLLTAFTAIASVPSLFFCLSPLVAYLKSHYGLADPFVSQCCFKSVPLIQGLLFLTCSVTVAMWLVSGHWILNNLLGIAICVAFVSHVRLPNVKICAILLACLSLYALCWVFFAERNFSANVMVSVATQQELDPVRTVADRLGFPDLRLITKKLELPMKIIFPRNFLGGAVPERGAADFTMLGVADMAVPGMFVALVLCFDYRESRDPVKLSELNFLKGHKYTWYALLGYAMGLITALAAGVLTRLPQPALIYLVPCTLGPVIVASWMRKELAELWVGRMPSFNDKSRQFEAGEQTVHHS